MEQSDFQLLEELAYIRGVLREAEASTRELPTKLRFSHEDADGWPALRLYVVGHSEQGAPSLRITANDRKQIVVRLSSDATPTLVDITEVTAPELLSKAVATAISELLARVANKPLEDIAKDELQSDSFARDELFEQEDVVEEIEALPEIKI